MAGESNKNSSPSDDSEQKIVAHIGNDNGGDKRRPRLPSVSKKRFFSLLLVIFIVVGGFFLILHLIKGPKVYAEVAGHKIYKQDIETMQVVNGKKTGITDKQAATVLADKYLSEAMVEQQGIKVTQADVVSAYGKTIIDQKKSDPYGYQNLVNQLYFTELIDHNVGTYQGKLLVANFSRYVPYQSALLPKQKAETPQLGNAAAIEQDKQYAETFITNLYNQIKSKQITFDQAIQEEHDDPVVGKEAYVTQQHSGSFSGTLGQIGLLSARSIRSKLSAMKAGQLSEPFVVRVSNSSTDSSSTAESYFLVVQMDKVSGGSSGMTFEQQLAQSKKSLGYKINV